jgi:hypothetical protein
MKYVWEGEYYVDSFRAFIIYFYHQLQGISLLAHTRPIRISVDLSITL